ncbi:MAG: hypothetical protein ABW046_18075 [Actinoplanes sp.]
MKNLRGSFVAAALAGLVGTSLTGCGGDAAEDKPADPKAALAGSATGLTAGNYAFDASQPNSTAKGIVHVPSKSVTLSMIEQDKEAGEMKIDIRMLEPDRWMKITMDTSEMTAGLDSIDTSNPEAAKMAKGLQQMADMFSGKSWYHVDLSKMKDKTDLTFDPAKPDLTGASELVAAIVTAEGDEHTITGTLDATKVTEENALVDTDDVEAIGAAASTLPYTATLDDEGRLTQLVLDVPKAGDTPAGKWTLNISGYGAQAAQTKPDGKVTEMPASGYESLNS